MQLYTHVSGNPSRIRLSVVSDIVLKVVFACTSRENSVTCDYGIMFGVTRFSWTERVLTITRESLAVTLALNFSTNEARANARDYLKSDVYDITFPCWPAVSLRCNGRTCGRKTAWNVHCPAIGSSSNRITRSRGCNTDVRSCYALTRRSDYQPALPMLLRVHTHHPQLCLKQIFRRF
jgi:hypothetical protein